MFGAKAFSFWKEVIFTDKIRVNLTFLGSMDNGFYGENSMESLKKKTCARL